LQLKEGVSEDLYVAKLSTLVGNINACSANESDQMLAYYQEYLQVLLSAHSVTWYAAYKGAYGRELWQTTIMNGWKVVDVACPLGTERAFAEAAKSYFKKAREEGDIDPQVTHSVETAGETRVKLIGDVASPEQWSQHWMSERLKLQGVGERMVGTFTLSDESESYFLVDRPPQAEPFSEDNRRVFFDALISFPRLHHWLFLERGLVSPAKRPLSPREREVLNKLLTAMSEKDIADAMSLSQGTVHNYVSDIYKKFNVQSRYELIQLWLQPIANTSMSAMK
jgi:DNA-binding CsgD family transcriptional regulator